ncbi:MAG: hypothetical protein INR62_09815 [Rhodospirillales bacterium]|nr:hypothetical protein [Acetobacter sp.]
MNAQSDGDGTATQPAVQPEFTLEEVEKAIDMFIGKAPQRGVDRELWAAREGIRYLRRRRKAAVRAQEEDTATQEEYAKAKRKQEDRERECPGDLPFESAVKHIVMVDRWERALPLFKKWLAFSESRARERGMVISVEDKSGKGLGGQMTLAEPGDFKPVEAAVENFLLVHRNGILPKAEIQHLRETFVAEEPFFRTALASASGKKGAAVRKTLDAS